MTTKALEPSAHGIQKCDTSDQPRGYCQKLFRAFREVFSVETVTERLVFWKEQKNNKAIIRLVPNLERTSKADDKVVGINIEDISAAKILIGNYAAGCRLSTVRWELYGDFDLTVFLDIGRFDSYDLFEGLDCDKAQLLARQGIVPTGDWDFDAIIVMHKCPTCHQVFDRTSILYRPLIPCQSCGRKQDFAQQRSIVQGLLADFEVVSNRFGIIHPVRAHKGQFPLQYYLDPVANSIVYWAICAMFDSNSSLRKFYGILGNQYTSFRGLFDRSLFRLMTMDKKLGLQEYFRQCIEQASGNDGVIFVSSLKRLSEALAFPDQFSVEKNLWWLRSMDIRMIRDFLPDLINKIILNHKTIKLTERTKNK
ncbi:MAG: hypothetical protein A3D50_01400 [Candidatus Taylorbacteria bacterium RIFCSPHIGHO2_02_FULL_44_12]|nr:MAG: hypothetical protein A3D50_01400 [Candidatus Taylorbacteria bacterium RIFCSPHIGHO2_02_FULL_44_12]